MSGQIIRLGTGQTGQQVVTIEPPKKVEINPAHKGILLRDTQTGKFAPFKSKA